MKNCFKTLCTDCVGLEHDDCDKLEEQATIEIDTNYVESMLPFLKDMRVCAN